MARRVRAGTLDDAQVQVPNVSPLSLADLSGAIERGDMRGHGVVRVVPTKHPTRGAMSSWFAQHRPSPEYLSIERRRAQRQRETAQMSDALLEIERRTIRVE